MSDAKDRRIEALQAALQAKDELIEALTAKADAFQALAEARKGADRAAERRAARGLRELRALPVRGGRLMESVAVVKRRPCITGFGGPVCRVGGKLHRAQSRLPPGSQQPGFCPNRCIPAPEFREK